MKYTAVSDDGIYDPMDAMNVEDRASDPDDGIDYDVLITEIVADDRAGHGWYFPGGVSFKPWFDDVLTSVRHRRETRGVA
jgi:hypothetical protein